jgi:hypothetical protein
MREQPAHEYIITNTRLCREAVHAGLAPVLPRGALDRLIERLRRCRHELHVQPLRRDA